jgi:hypothetical protein
MGIDGHAADGVADYRVITMAVMTTVVAMMMMRVIMFFMQCHIRLQMLARAVGSSYEPSSNWKVKHFSNRPQNCREANFADRFRMTISVK